MVGRLFSGDGQFGFDLRDLLTCLFVVGKSGPVFPFDLLAQSTCILPNNPADEEANNKTKCPAYGEGDTPIKEEGFG